MTKCKGCQKQVRKTTIAMLLTPGGLKGACVCRDCAKGGVLLVAPKLGPIVKQKVIKSDGVKRAIRRIRMLASAASATGFDLKVEAFESAIEVLKHECGE
jgi:hypothetical protein